MLQCSLDIFLSFAPDFKNMGKNTWLLLSMFLLASLASNAQDFELGLNLGFSQYQGDLGARTSEDIQRARLTGNKLAIGLVARKYFNPHWALRGGILFGSLSGDDNKQGENSDRERRNLSFKSSLLEFNLGLEWNIFKYIPGSENHRFTPYLFAGIGGFLFNPKGEFDGTKYNLQDVTYVRKEKNGQDVLLDYSKFQLAIPMGVGIKYNVSQLWSLGFEVGWRKTFTDYIDNVSNEYTGDAKALLAQGKRPEAFFTDRWGTDANMAPDDPNKKFRPNSGRGNSDLDSYYFAMFSLSKTFRKYACVSRNVIDLD